MDAIAEKTDTIKRASENPAQRTRIRLLAALAVSVLVCVAGFTGYWFLIGSKVVSTDNAFVGADTAQVTPQIPGTVVNVEVADTHTVKAGDVLVRLDPAEAEASVAFAKADLDRAVLAINQTIASNSALDAQVRQRQSDLDRARNDLARRIAAGNDGAVSNEEVSHARESVASAIAGLNIAAGQLKAGRAATNGYRASNHPEVARARAHLVQAELDLARTTIRAPIDGVITRRTVQNGERVAAGAVLMTIVPTGSLYVDANFKEVQIARVRPGQRATLRSDVYGSQVIFHGRVVGISGGTGSAFAIIPAQNATGNWIKVVQRVPVRIELDPSDLSAHPLRVGLSMRAQIDTSS